MLRECKADSATLVAYGRLVMGLLIAVRDLDVDDWVVEGAAVAVLVWLELIVGDRDLPGSVEALRD